MITVSASEFKAKCLQMMDGVAESGETILITKHGKPIAKMMPCHPPLALLHGFLQGQIRHNGSHSTESFDTSEYWANWNEERNLE